MRGLCTNCNTIKNLRGSLCGNCYNKKLLASKPIRVLDTMNEQHRKTKAAWQKNHPEITAQYCKRWRKSHPGYINNLKALAKLQKDTPVRTLQKAGIDTEFMRGQLEEHRRQKLAMEIEEGMALIFS